MRATLKYYKGKDNRLRRVVTYINCFNRSWRIKVFPEVNNE